jgi:predicted nucleic acid-binding protein
MSTVYVETTIPSYLIARPSRDLVVAGHQQITIEWWERSRDHFELFISEAVLEEIRAGDAELARRRLDEVGELPILRIDEECRRLADVYSARLGLHAGAQADIVHIATAVAYELDYLVTWNCRHIANGRIIRRLMATNDEIGLRTPLILTPEELLYGWEGEGT